MLRVLWGQVTFHHFECKHLTFADADNPKLPESIRHSDLKIEDWNPLIVAEAKTSEDAFSVVTVKLTFFTEA